MLQQLGMALIALNPASRAQYQVPDNIDGMVVTEVAPESDAARKGIRPGMVIDELNQMDIRSKTDVETALDEVIADGAAPYWRIFCLIRAGDAISEFALILMVNKGFSLLQA